MTTETTGDKIIRELEQRGFKKVGPNEWRGNCPWRAGSDSKAFAVKIDADGEHGAFHDHVTGEQGSLYQLAERLGIETPKAQAQETKRPYTNLADYAAAHYAPVEAFEAAGWQADTHKERPCLTYTVGGKLRYRYLDGNTPAYEWEKGGKPAWYGLKRAVATANGRALVLCNGEASTIAAQHHGLPACAWAGGEQKLPSNALDELMAAYTGPIILAYDCDETGQRVAREVAEQLTSVGFDVRIADLGMTTHGDLADFCGLHTTTAYAELDKRGTAYTPDVQAVKESARKLEAQVKAAQADPVETMTKEAQKLEAQVERIAAALAPPRVLELHDMAAAVLDPAANARRWPLLPIPELSALVGPLKPELYVIYGAPNMGKSWMASSIAAALTKTGTGLIISTEMNPQDFFRRMASYASRVPLIRMDDGIASDIERSAWNKAAAAFKGHEGRAIDMSSPTPKQVVREAVRAQKEIGLDWLVVDSATRMQGVGDSVYERTSSIANGLQNLSRDLNVPVIMTSQIGRDVTDRPAGKRQPRLDDAYGSGAIEQNAGVVLGLYRHDYYVTKELEALDDVAYPPNTARFILLKHRNRPMPDIPYCTVRYEPGCGFYPFQPHVTNRKEKSA